MVWVVVGVAVLADTGALLHVARAPLDAGVDRRPMYQPHQCRHQIPQHPLYGDMAAKYWNGLNLFLF